MQTKIERINFTYSFLKHIDVSKAIGLPSVAMYCIILNGNKVHMKYIFKSLLLFDIDHLDFKYKYIYICASCSLFILFHRFYKITLMNIFIRWKLFCLVYICFLLHLILLQYFIGSDVPLSSPPSSPRGGLLKSSLVSFNTSMCHA